MEFFGIDWTTKNILKTNTKPTMKKVFFLIIILSVVSCSSPLDKSIFEKLTVNELKESIEKDSLFKNTYEYIVLVRDTILKSDIQKVKFADLTYSQIFKVVKYASDTSFLKPFNERMEIEWQGKYGIYSTKVDSVSNYWKKYMENNSLEQYVQVELEKIDKEYYSYAGGIRNINLGFRLTPLKGEVQQIRFGYNLVAKINDKNNDGSSLSSALDKSWCLTTSPFSKPIVRYWESNYKNKEILESKTLETLTRDYNIYIEIDEVRIAGVNMSNEDLNIPKSVSNHWKYENEEGLQDLYFDDIVEEVLDKEYMDENEYRNVELKKILKNKDPLVYDFITLGS